MQGTYGKAHGTFAVANAPSGSVRDEAIYITATGPSAVAGSAAVNTFFLHQSIDAALGDAANNKSLSTTDQSGVCAN